MGEAFVREGLGGCQIESTNTSRSKYLIQNSAQQNYIKHMEFGRIKILY